MHHCTLCDTYHNNPKQVRAHLNSSCHERAIAQRERHRERASRRLFMWSTCMQMQKIDPWHVAWQPHLYLIQDEFQSYWPIMEYAEKQFKRVRGMHASHMRSWWALVCMRLPTHCVTIEILSWLAPSVAMNWSEPHTHYSRNGNLNLQNSISMGGFQRDPNHSSYHAITSQNTTRTCRHSFNRCASPMDLD